MLVGRELRGKKEQKGVGESYGSRNMEVWIEKELRGEGSVGVGVWKQALVKKELRRRREAE